MSQFNYTLPSGAEFVVFGPPGATQAEADRIFYEQVAAGSLVGYTAGQQLTSTATQITKFELSRLDRGTAGVDTPAVLAIVQGLPVVSGIPNLSNVLLTNPINESNIVNIKGNDLEPSGVGPLSPYQTQKILAQIANLVEQESDQISENKGIGQYGFTCYALEQAGYVKPGTSLRFFSQNPEDFITVMSSPSVWTGKDGVYSLNDLLNDPLLQSRIQVQLMQQGYQDLLDNGTIAQPVSTSIGLSTGQVYTNSGLQSVQALTVASLLSSTNVDLLSGVVKTALSSSTVLNQLLGGLNVNLSTIGSGAVNSLTSGLENLGNLANLNFASIGTNISNQITGSIGALVTNASKFGAQATTLWANATNFDGIAGLAQSNLNSITTKLTNLVPGSLSNLTSSLDVFGKAGSFATNFANPLGNLNNLGNLSSLGNLGALQGQLTGALGNLGNLANIGSISNLFGGSGDLVSGTAVAAGFNNTVNRTTLDAAFARIVGSSKVPLPIYQYPSLATLGPRLDVQQALSFLKNQSGSGSNVFGQTVTV